MDLLRVYEAGKIFVKEEKDTYIGLIFFLLLGVGAVKYVFIPIFEQLNDYIVHISIPLSIIIVVIWAYNRNIPVVKDQFNIGIAQFNVLLLNAKTDMSSEAERDLKRSLVDYIFSALHFNKEHLSLEKYVEILRLPPRIKLTVKNSKKVTKKVGADLIIWGDAYYDNQFLYFRPRFEFLKEPKNVYYRKFKKKLNHLDTFKLDLSKSLEDEDTDLSKLLHYLVYLGLMFQGIKLMNEDKFSRARESFEFALDSMRTRAFNNKSLSDIYLATRFFYAQNFHMWGNHLLNQKRNRKKALELYDLGAQSFFKRAVEMKKFKSIDDDSRIENTLVYGIYLLIKEGKNREASKKLDSMKKSFDKDNIYLYHLYKGLSQSNPKNAVRFFDQALKKTKHPDLCYEKIADYFFSKGKFKDSIKYFEKRLGTNERQYYNPSLLEEDAHEKLSIAYMKEFNIVKGIREKLIAQSNKSKNLQEGKVLVAE